MAGAELHAVLCPEEKESLRPEKKNPVSRHVFCPEELSHMAVSANLNESYKRNTAESWTDDAGSRNGRWFPYNFKKFSSKYDSDWLRKTMPGFDPVELSKKLVRIDSQNPGPQEEECARFCAGWFRERGFEVEVQTVASGRPNLIAKMTGNGSHRPLVFLAHLDTVPAGEGVTSCVITKSIVE